jgi:hypothetical protein
MPEHRPRANEATREGEIQRFHDRPGAGSSQHGPADWIRCPVFTALFEAGASVRGFRRRWSNPDQAGVGYHFVRDTYRIPGSNHARATWKQCPQQMVLREQLSRIEHLTAGLSPRMDSERQHGIRAAGRRSRTDPGLPGHAPLRPATMQPQSWIQYGGLVDRQGPAIWPASPLSLAHPMLSDSH